MNTVHLINQLSKSFRDKRIYIRIKGSEKLYEIVEVNNQLQVMLGEHRILAECIVVEESEHKKI